MSETSKAPSTDLTIGPVAQTLVNFSLPFMIGTLLQTLYSTVDTIVVGQYMGVQACRRYPTEVSSCR